jgi:hypothetical protein
MYAFRRSASNFGRGEAADDREGGERRPVDIRTVRGWKESPTKRVVEIQSRRDWFICKLICDGPGPLHVVARR